MVGTTLSNRYRLVKELGAGGAGAVYKALDMTLRRPVAVKMLHPEKTGSEQLLQRFYREARKASQLSHANSVTVHDFGRTSDGTFFLVMEYLRGFSLKQVQLMERTLEPGRVASIVEQVCDSLGEAHGLGMVHRDLKPDNIFLTAKGGQRDVVKLVDFGLAKTLGSDTDHVTRKGTPGTPNYMSPEQISTGEADSRSDLYSLGAVMYAVLTGTPVFTGKAQMVDVLWAHVNEAPEPPSRRAPERGIPDDLERVVLKCLNKDRDARYQTAGELKLALESTQVSAQWTDERSFAAWDTYILPPEDEDLNFDNAPMVAEEVSPTPSRPVTFDSTGLRRHVSEEDERRMEEQRAAKAGSPPPPPPPPPPSSAPSGRSQPAPPGPAPPHLTPIRGDEAIPWPLLIAVSAAVAILTAGIVVWFLGSSTGG